MAHLPLDTAPNTSPLTAAITWVLAQLRLPAPKTPDQHLRAQATRAQARQAVDRLLR